VNERRQKNKCFFVTFFFSLKKKYVWSGGSGKKGVFLVGGTPSFLGGGGGGGDHMNIQMVAVMFSFGMGTGGSRLNGEDDLYRCFPSI
jgi:hypothetical protein